MHPASDTLVEFVLEKTQRRRFLESLMDGAKPIGLATSAGLVLLFALVASASIWSATRRIARLDISAILRNE